jgi:hypothetical protein
VNSVELSTPKRTFVSEVRSKLREDLRWCRRSIINQALHLASAVAFVCGCVLLPVDMIGAVVLWALVGIALRLVGTYSVYLLHDATTWQQTEVTRVQVITTSGALDRDKQIGVVERLNRSSQLISPDLHEVNIRNSPLVIAFLFEWI